MAAGLHGARRSARCTRCTRTSCGRATRRRRSATPSTGSATAGRSAPAGCSPGSSARARTSRSSRSPPTSTRASRPSPSTRCRCRTCRRPETLPALADDRRPGTASGRRMARDRPGGRAAAPRGPVRARRRSRRRTPRPGIWMRVAGRLPDDPAVHAAALTFVSDLTLLSAGLARLGGGWDGTSSAPASTTRSGSTRRCGPTSGSSTRPTARPPPAAGRCASGRSGRPTARTSPPWPRRGSPVAGGLTARRSAPAGRSSSAAAARASAWRAARPALGLVAAARLPARRSAVLPARASRSAAAAAKSAASQSWFSHSSAQTRSTCARVVAGAPIGHAQHDLAADGGVGQEHLAAVVEPLEQGHRGDVGVHVVGPARAQADQRRTGAARRRRTARRPSAQPASSWASATCAADVRAQPLGAVPAEHEPQLEGAEPAAERDLPVAEVDDGAGVGGGVAQVLREDRQGAGEGGPVGDPEQGGVEAGEQPLVRVGGVAVGPLDAVLQRAQLGDDAR